ncbi:MAG: hypothetical protein JWN39_403 [Ilumatobacteraceae bacterium]|nr:hypothetical protein [Ilumatobacteraceae bacterium]
MRTQPATDHDPLRFRAATLDEAIEQAERSLGARARVVSANHVRRGGIAGFFAADLGVEISVVLEDETVEEALSRIVDEAAARERAEPREIDAPARIEMSMAPGFAQALRIADEQTAVPMQQSADVVDTFTPEHPTSYPTTGSARPLAAFAAAASLPMVEPVAAPIAERITMPVTMPTTVPVAQAIPPAVVPTTEIDDVRAPGDSKIERLEAAFASLRASAGAPTVRANAAPTRRQVELVVVATEQIIDTITQHHETGKLRVRVAMRSSNGAEVEVQAEWNDNRQVTA